MLDGDTALLHGYAGANTKLLCTAVYGGRTLYRDTVTDRYAGICLEVDQHHTGAVAKQEALSVDTDDHTVCLEITVFTCDDGSDIGCLQLGRNGIVGIGLGSRRLRSGRLGSRRLRSGRLRGGRLRGGRLRSGRLRSGRLRGGRLCSRRLGCRRLSCGRLGGFFALQGNKACIDAHAAGKRGFHQGGCRKGLFPNAVVPVPATEYVAFLFGVGRQFDFFCAVGGNGVVYFTIHHEVQLQFHTAAGCQ